MAKDESAGRQIKCPKCGGTIRVPVFPTADKQPSAARDASPSIARPTLAPQHSVRPAVAAIPVGIPLPVNQTATSAPRQPVTPPTKADLRAAVRQRLAQGITGPIVPVKPSFLYLAGMSWAAVIMLVLPLIYLAVIGLTIWAIQYHATHHIGILSTVRGRGAILMLAIYAGPIVGGVIMVLFMIKPLFAPPAEEGRTRYLTRQGEPVLFDFVDKLCEAVGAPRPTKIEVDATVNAAAGFRRGWLSLFGQDLVLTIGAPLAAGLTMEQFAGVLAHEFGHLSQGMGMRISFIVRNISHWFTRVVYERDQWDVWLAESHEDADWRWAIIMGFSQLCVWTSRRVLWILMFVGHLVAGYLLRQMEFNADLHEIRFGGSHTFEAATHRLRELNVANTVVMHMLVRNLNSGDLPDNLAKLLLARSTELPANLAAQLRASLEKETTSWFSSHPCDRQRIEWARRENAAGVFRYHGAACELFSDFDTLCRNVTGDFYRSIFGTRFNVKAMVSTDELLAKEAS